MTLSSNVGSIPDVECLFTEIIFPTHKVLIGLAPDGVDDLSVLEDMFSRPRYPDIIIRGGFNRNYSSLIVAQAL